MAMDDTPKSDPSAFWLSPNDFRRLIIFVANDDVVCKLPSSLNSNGLDAQKSVARIGPDGLVRTETLPSYHLMSSRV
jgi:hypothetical protein